MREKIILAPSANENELIKDLALHGVNTINFRVYSAGELARVALRKSNISVPNDFLTSSEEHAITAKAITGIDYFQSSKFSDIQTVTSAIKTMRGLVVGEDEKNQIETCLRKGIFTNKNEALIRAYNNYMKILNDNCLIDSIALIRLASLKSNEMDADFITLKEYPLNPLQTSLINRVSGNKVSQIALKDLYNVDEKKISIKGISNCYGAPNEVENILNKIYSDCRLDECIVAVTDIKTYGQLFFDYALLYNIPMTFGSGIPIINSNPAKLLSSYYKWMTTGFFSAGALMQMIYSREFDYEVLKAEYPEETEGFNKKKYKEILGGIRFTNDAAVNAERLEKYKEAVRQEELSIEEDNEKAVLELSHKKDSIPFLEVAARELALKPHEFINKYAKVRNGGKNSSEKIIRRLDMTALSVISGELKNMQLNDIGQSTEDVISNILKANICSQQSMPGMIHITNISKALNTVRKNLFIAGLTSNSYPGSPKENYLLLDNDLEQFGEVASFETSKGKILRKQERLMDLVKLSVSLNSSVYISYPGLNVSELKKENASSMIFELFRMEHGSTATVKDLNNSIEKVEYFDPPISITREIGKMYNKGIELILDDENTVLGDDNTPWNIDRSYSPSALSDFFECKRRFLLKHILGISMPIDDDPFETISSVKAGTLAHTLMEKLANSDMSKQEFLDLARDYFYRFINQNPPLINDNVQSELLVFLDMMENAYKSNPHREIVLAEENVGAIHETGVRLCGYPDRVERLGDGKCVVVDYKTKRQIDHKNNDIDTCLQAIIYAYILESRGYEVSSCEYRYIRLDSIVTCKYDEEMKKALNEKLKYFKECMMQGDFSLAASAEVCTNCKYSSICGK